MQLENVGIAAAHCGDLLSRRYGLAFLHQNGVVVGIGGDGGGIVADEDEFAVTAYFLTRIQYFARRRRFNRLTLLAVDVYAFAARAVVGLDDIAAAVFHRPLHVQAVDRHDGALGGRVCRRRTAAARCVPADAQYLSGLDLRGVAQVVPCGQRADALPVTFGDAVERVAALYAVVAVGNGAGAGSRAGGKKKGGCRGSGKFFQCRNGLCFHRT